MESPSRVLRALLAVTDFGFIAYWSVSALHLLPPSVLFKDSENPVLVAWNWSFLPLDLLASGLGLLALFLARRQSASWRGAAILSLALTFCAGLMALSFWTLSRDFEWIWWLPNLFLAIWPLCFIAGLVRRSDQKISA